MSRGHLVVISAPSGAGKTTICRRLQAAHSDWHFSVSATTRPRREHETDGKWNLVATEADWSTKCVFQPGRNAAGPYQITVTWYISEDTIPGNYRLGHRCRLITGPEAEPTELEGSSDVFRVVDSSDR